MERFGCGPHTEAGCAAHSLWSCFGKTLVPWKKNTTVVSDGESWEGMLGKEDSSIAETCGTARHPLQGLQRALHQAKARLKGRQDTSSPCPPLSEVQQGSCKPTRGF